MKTEKRGPPFRSKTVSRTGKRIVQEEATLPWTDYLEKKK